MAQDDQEELHSSAPFSVDFDRSRGIAVVTMNGTAPGNAMGWAVWQALPGLVASLEAQTDVRAVVLRGAADCFSIGLDVRWYLTHYRRMARGGDGAVGFRSQLLDEALRMQDSLSAIVRSRLPFVAAVHGACVGAGLDLVSACDVRLAATDAYFSLREVRVGIVADLGSLQRLPRLIGAGATRELALTGRDVPADQAQALGLVTRILDTPAELFAYAGEQAALIASYPPQVVAGIKTICEQTQDLTMDAGLRYTAVWNSAFLPSPELVDRLAGALRENGS